MREDASRHALNSNYVATLRRAPEPFGVSELVLSGTLRVLTHPQVFTSPTPAVEAYAFVDALRLTPNCVLVSPGPRHWTIFRALLEPTSATGHPISVAWHAALAIEHGCEWISDDADLARFPGLRRGRPG